MNKWLVLVPVLAGLLALGACGGGGGDENGGPVISSGDFTPSLEGWEFYSGSGESAGVEHEEYGLVAYYDYEGRRQVTNRYRYPVEAPTVAGTWTGEWGGIFASAAHRGEARIAVTIDPDVTRGFTTHAVVHLDDFPHWGDFESVPIGVSLNGHFAEYGSAHAGSAPDDRIFSSIEGWFGGPDQVGVVGAFHGRHYDLEASFKTVFYGERR